LAQKLIALNFSQKVLNFRKIYTPKFLGCYTIEPQFCLGSKFAPRRVRVLELDFRVLKP
jgi:hypothetical protein